MLLITLLAMCLASAHALSAPAAAAAPLLNISIASIGGKPGYHLAADNQTFFAQFGINLTLISVPNSQVGFQGMLNGSWPLFSAVVDNLVERYVNEGQTWAQVVAGSDQGKGVGLWGNTKLGITSIAALSAHKLTVDDFKSGLTPALLYMLKKAGVAYPALGTATGFQVLGGTPLRYAALQAGHSATNASDLTYGTMLLTPFDVLAAQNPSTFTLLQSLADVSPLTSPFQSAAVMVNKAWARANSCTLSRVLAAFILGDRFSKKSTNAAVMKALLIKALGPSGIVNDANASRVLADIVNATTGENNDVLLNRAGMRNICNIRAEVNGFLNVTTPGGPFSPPNCKTYALPTSDGLYDDSYHKEALKLAKGGKHSCSSS